MPRKPDLTKKERYNDPFPSRLRELIRERDVTQEQLKDVLSLSKRQSVTSYVDGETLPTIDKLVAIADYFGVTPDYLLSYSEAPTNDSADKFICDETGLSYGALGTLRFDRRSRDELNELIENSTHIIDELIQLRKDSQLLKSIIVQSGVDGLLDGPFDFPEFDLSPEYISDHSSELYTQHSAMQFSLFRAIEAFRRFIYSSYEYDFLDAAATKLKEAVLRFELENGGTENGEHFETAEN